MTGSPFIKPIERIAKGSTLMPRQGALSFDASVFSVTDAPAAVYTDQQGAQVNGGTAVSLSVGKLASSYIRPTGSGATAGLRIGRFDIDPLGAIPGSLTIGNDDGGGDALKIDGSTSEITTTYTLRVGGAGGPLLTVEALSLPTVASPAVPAVGFCALTFDGTDLKPIDHSGNPVALTVDTLTAGTITTPGVVCGGGELILSNGAIRFTEMAAPGAPPASGKCYLYLDSGTGKLTQQNSDSSTHALY